MMAEIWRGGSKLGELEVEYLDYGSDTVWFQRRPPFDIIDGDSLIIDGKMIEVSGVGEKGQPKVGRA